MNGRKKLTIVDKLTPVYYSLRRIGLKRVGSDAVSVANLAILNAGGDVIGGDTPAVTLTAAEKTALVAFITRELGVYETATGLAEWTGE